MNKREKKTFLIVHKSRKTEEKIRLYMKCIITAHIF